MPSTPLVGTWNLISWENTTADGEVGYPLGEDARGRLTYTQDGFMAVAITRSARTPFLAGDLLSGSTDEMAHAAATYVSYCGRYELDGDAVVHHVELSLFPNWEGDSQERSVEIGGDRLTLTTRPLLLDGRQRTARLVWERAKTTDPLMPSATTAATTPAQTT